MNCKAICAGISMFGFLVTEALASDVGDQKQDENVGKSRQLELLFTCASSHPFLSIKWSDGDNMKAAEATSAFLDAPSVTPQMIVDKARECFSALKNEPGMTEVIFNSIELRCGVGPDIKRGRIVVGRVN